MTQTLAAVHVVIPAGGVGMRMGAEVPKQYLNLLGEPVIAHTIKRFAALQPASITVAVAATDTHFKALSVAAHCCTVSAGETRRDSVLAGLATLVDPEAWVMVHDAVRPCVRAQDILRLYAEVAGHPVGGLLAVPCQDAVMEGSSDRLLTTGGDGQRWLAQTPQMFRVGALFTAMSELALATDEAQAIEATGKQPKIVEGSPDNIKITTREDMAAAEFLLGQMTS